MASSPITSWQIEGGKLEIVTDFIFLGSKITEDSNCSHEIKRCLLLGRKADKPRQHFKKQRHYFTDKSPSCQSHGFSSSHVWMWELDHKEGWAKNWCFWIVVLEKTLKSPLDSKEIKPINPKGNQPWLFIEGLMLKLKFLYFGHLMQSANSLEKTLMLGKTEGRRRRGRQRTRWLDGITDSMDVNVSELWEMVKDREAWVLRSMRSQESDRTERLNNNRSPTPGYLVIEEAEHGSELRSDSTARTLGHRTQVPGAWAQKCVTDAHSEPAWSPQAPG